MLVHHLRDSVAQQHNILVKGLDLALQFDAIDKVNRDWYMLAAQGVEKGVLKKLAFVAHDILRVQNCCCNSARYHRRAWHFRVYEIAPGGNAGVTGARALDVFNGLYLPQKDCETS